MKFLHLSDLHLGLRLHEQSLIEDQKYMLKCVTQTVAENGIDCVFIAGDIYDKSVPPADAVTVMDSFISELAKMNVPVFISSGNHDSTERLSFGSSVMSANGIYFSPVYDGSVTPVTVKDEFGELDIWMIPFIKPVNVRRFFEDTVIDTYTDAMRAVISAMPIDSKKRNILICHQNVGLAEQCDSSVGGLDMIDAAVFEPFDYVALGHIHQPYPVLRDSIRYCGTVLCYDFKFCDDDRGFTVIDIDGDGKITKNILPFYPLHAMMNLRGELARLISPDNVDSRAVQSYLHVTLTDEQETIDAVGKLRAVYPHVMSVEYDNTRTRTERYINLGGDASEKSPFELFSEFYCLQNNAPLTDEQSEIVKNVIDEVWGEAQ